MFLQATSTPPSLPFDFTLSGALSILFYLVLAVSLVMTAVFLYHWLRYHVGAFRLLAVIALYGVGLFFLLTTAYGFLLAL